MRQSGTSTEFRKSQHNSGSFVARAYSSVSWLSWRVLPTLLGGLILRLWMRHAFPPTDVDTQIYGDMAKNLLLHHQFATTLPGGVLHPTLLRLPGYPLFLAACYALFGVANDTAVLAVQITLELIACLLLADFVRRTVSLRAAWNTLWIATLCPFTAIYTVSGLAESVTVSAIMIALWALQQHLDAAEQAARTPAQSNPHPWAWLLLFTAAITFAALARPDGALVAIALWPALILSRGPSVPLRTALRRAILCALLAVSPFAFWAARNWAVFHVFQPLAPRSASDPGEPVYPGWEHWTSTWCLDFSCTYEVYWAGDDDHLNIASLPDWAFDSPQERAQTAQLFTDYNRTNSFSTPIDARFEALAQIRQSHHPWRTQLGLPIGRVLDMTFRPRVENLTIDIRWWQYSLHHAETEFSLAYAALNLLIIALAIAGACYRPPLWQYMALYILLRSLMLLQVVGPEARYTIEFFPFLYALAGTALWRIFRHRPLPSPHPS